MRRPAPKSAARAIDCVARDVRRIISNRSFVNTAATIAAIEQNQYARQRPL
jgi:hypothetical protein